MESQPIILAIVFILVAASLTYMVMNINNPPVTYDIKPVNVSISTTPGAECSSGQEKHCTISGCSGVKKCSSGYWSECSLDKQCSSGESKVCKYSACSDGTQTCDECGKWALCTPFPGQNASFNDSIACNSS